MHPLPVDIWSSTSGYRAVNSTGVKHPYSQAHPRKAAHIQRGVNVCLNSRQRCSSNQFGSQWRGSGRGGRRALRLPGGSMLLCAVARLSGAFMVKRTFPSLQLPSSVQKKCKFLTLSLLVKISLILPALLTHSSAATATRPSTAGCFSLNLGPPWRT